MKPVLCILFIMLGVGCLAQPEKQAGNIFIITTDGFRWQEVFNGADESLISDSHFVKDTALSRQQYWDTCLESRRRKLLPFFWNVVARSGQLLGNRNYRNEVNLSNWYKISYAGYNEILTGYADITFIPNLAVENRNTNILEYLNSQPDYAGKVAAFSSWNVFPYILNEKRSGVPVNSGYEKIEEDNDDARLVNQVQDKITGKGNTRHDMLTYAGAKGYIEHHHPKVVLLGFGETDEFAHLKRYDRYLQKAHMVDEMIAELWYYVQTDPFYKNNTTFIITTDHGRGKKNATWQTHGFWVKGSGEAWLAMLGPGIFPVGEVQKEQKIYQKQIAATIAMLLGEEFKANHGIAKPIDLTGKSNQLTDLEGIVFVK